MMIFMADTEDDKEKIQNIQKRLKEGMMNERENVVMIKMENMKRVIDKVFKEEFGGKLIEK